MIGPDAADLAPTAWGYLGLVPGLAVSIGTLGGVFIAGARFWRTIIRERSPRPDDPHPVTQPHEIATAVSDGVKSAMTAHLGQLELMQRAWRAEQREDAVKFLNQIERVVREVVGQAAA